MYSAWIIVKNYVTSSVWPARLTLGVFAVSCSSPLSLSFLSVPVLMGWKDLLSSVRFLFRSQLEPCGSIYTSRIKLFISTSI